MAATLTCVLIILSSTTLVNVITVTGCFDNDEAALLAFKVKILGGDHDSGLSSLASWNRSSKYCSWRGVTCSRTHPGRVSVLNLGSSGLHGTISQAIGNLSFLTTLNLSSNKLSGEIPPTISHLRRLKLLYLEDNMLDGTIPANLTYTSLKSVVLFSNQLSGSLPSELGSMLALENLVLDNNSFTGCILPSFANLTSLKILGLSTNKLEGSIPSILGNNAHIKFLSLSDNKLYGMVPRSLYNISSMTTFSVEGNKLHGNLPVDLGNCFPGMKNLYLGGNNFTGPIPHSVTNLSVLEIFSIVSNNINGIVPATIGRSRALSYLGLGYNLLEASRPQDWAFITSLTNCTQLQYLTLNDNQLGGELPNSLGNLSSGLVMLYMTENNFSGSIPPGIGNLASLQVIDLGSNALTGVIPESIGKITNLYMLALYGNALLGHIPLSIGNLTQLSQFHLFSNNLQGPIPTTIGNLTRLSALDLSSNHLSGFIPKEVLHLPYLSQVLDLSHNSLEGPLPLEVGSLINLNELALQGNRLSGAIPDTIGNCIVMQLFYADDNSFQGNIPTSLKNMKGLTILNLTENKLNGSIPSGLGSISSLQQLHIAHNNLSGPIPEILQNLTSLFMLDVSFNDLQGSVPKEGIFRNLSGLKLSGNPGLCDGIPQLHLHVCAKPSKKSISKLLSKDLRIIIPAVAVFFAGLMLVVWLRYKKLKVSRRPPILPPLLVDEQLPRIPYHVLFRASDGFSEANIVGKGRYSTVYRATLENDSTTVAVKVFNLLQSGSLKSFEIECDALRIVRHRCLIKIITCCSSVDNQGKDFKALVFEYMPNSSLDKWIHPGLQGRPQGSPLSLSQRLNIAVDISDALDYLHNHCEPPIVHCDLKPSNILLTQDMGACVGDFGIARILSQAISKPLFNSNSSTGIRGTIGYVAPEYGEGLPISISGDVYSFGVVLLEMFTGKGPTDDAFQDALGLHGYAANGLEKDVMEIADPAMLLHELEPYNAVGQRGIPECLFSVIALGISCSKPFPRERMLVKDAATEMHAIRDAYLKCSNCLNV
ncbi:unnamed protein product [Urochloa humidicola]